MSASPCPPKRLIVAFDGEMTGQFMKKKNDCCKVDVMFAIGWAASSRKRRDAPLTDEKPKTMSWEDWWDENGYGMVAIDLQKPLECTWADWWSENGWEMDCFKFWGKPENIEKLDKMQDPSFTKLVKNEQEMMDTLNGALVRLEKGYDVIIPICDTMFFDSVWLSTKMLEAGYESMMYRRDDTKKGYSRMMWGREVSSYLRGVYNLAPYESSDAIEKKLLSRVPDFDPNGAHYPDIDAIGILSVMEEAIKVAQRKSEKQTCLKKKRKLC
jgi:hypothetical protein